MNANSLEARIDQWRATVQRDDPTGEADAGQREQQLREQLSALTAVGLSDDEAFLIAVRRLEQPRPAEAEPARDQRRPAWTMLAFAILAAVLVQLARLLAEVPAAESFWFLRDVSLFVLPVLAAYFAVVRRLTATRCLALGGIVAALALAVNLFPFEWWGSTELLVAIHLPAVLWFVVGAAFMGRELRSSAARMEFIRFTGEWAIYYVLIALGGAVLLGLTASVLGPVLPGAIEAVYTWVLPSGAAGAVIVAAWLVEAKKNLMGSFAPVLTMIFTPLFAIMLLASAISYLATGLGRDFDRDLLVVFDLLLLVVLALVVYGISARGTTRQAGLTDAVRLVAVGAAIILDLLVLASMFARIGELGFTPNRVAALGLNVLLLVNLVGAAWLIARMFTSRLPAIRQVRWQTAYLPVFACWVLFVVLALPPLFGFA